MASLLESAKDVFDRLSERKTQVLRAGHVPYPSGAGLHVGHPLGYIASDIVARYKRHRGFNVLHPMGYDAFGLPAEQYAIQTGQHPAITTEANIARYREQLDRIGFSFDWGREVRTCNADYYQWTQWIFIQLFHAWFNEASGKAESIDSLIAHLDAHGTENLRATHHGSPPAPRTSGPALTPRSAKPSCSSSASPSGPNLWSTGAPPWAPF